VTPRAVFDCMVFVQTIANAKGPAAACYELARVGKVVLYISPAVIAEVAEVTARPKLRKKLTAMTAEAVEAFLQDVIAHAVMVSDVPARFSYARDPKDEPYLNLALASDATHLVSWDKDLLDLMSDLAFRQQYSRLAVIDPPAFLREIVTHADTGPDVPREPTEESP
jgi:putative PIN family toxin of toxin-antitoxin system